MATGGTNQPLGAMKSSGPPSVALISSRSPVSSMSAGKSNEKRLRLTFTSEALTTLV